MTYNQAGFRGSLGDDKTVNIITNNNMPLLMQIHTSQWPRHCSIQRRRRSTTTWDGDQPNKCSGIRGMRVCWSVPAPIAPAAACGDKRPLNRMERSSQTPVCGVTLAALLVFPLVFYFEFSVGISILNIF
jgi:hypothetical protein